MKYEKPRILDIMMCDFSDVVTTSEMGAGSMGGNDVIDPNSYDPDNY